MQSLNELVRRGLKLPPPTADTSSQAQLGLAALL